MRPHGLSGCVFGGSQYVIHIGDADVPFVSSVKNLGVTWIQISACLNIYATAAKPHTYKSGI